MSSNSEFCSVARRCRGLTDRKLYLDAVTRAAAATAAAATQVRLIMSHRRVFTAAQLCTHRREEVRTVLHPADINQNPLCKSCLACNTLLIKAQNSGLLDWRGGKKLIRRLVFTHPWKGFRENILKHHANFSMAFLFACCITATPVKEQQFSVLRLWWKPDLKYPEPAFAEEGGIQKLKH